MRSRRLVLRGDGIPEHPQPFPPAVRVGNMVFSSAIGGYDPATGELPDDLDSQVRNAFAHVRTIMRLAGGGPQHIAKAGVYLTDRSHRDAVNRQWVELFPDEDDRPVRHTTVAPLAGGMLVQIEIVAVLDEVG